MTVGIFLLFGLDWLDLVTTVGCSVGGRERASRSIWEKMSSLLSSRSVVPRWIGDGDQDTIGDFELLVLLEICDDVAIGLVPLVVNAAPSSSMLSLPLDPWQDIAKVRLNALMLLLTLVVLAPVVVAKDLIVGGLEFSGFGAFAFLILMIGVVGGVMIDLVVCEC